ncbi:hypothetical protein ACQ4M3_37605 [Leptolyngbya sp. AN03gr2]|uniref:hypothetical protein n=1 Tax=unclassified Leptolyngbya TaxID=2650499 RepID=UPI003D31B05C
MQSWQLFLFSEVCRKYNLSKKEQAILLAKFPNEETVRSDQQIAQQAIDDDQLPIDAETVRRQLWTIYHDRFSPKANDDYFPDYDQKGRRAKDLQFQTWLKQRYSSWQANTREALPNSTVSNQFSTTNNPFVPLTGRVDDARLFFGREAEIKRIFEILNSGSSIALH